MFYDQEFIAKSWILMILLPRYKLLSTKWESKFKDYCIKELLEVQSGQKRSQNKELKELGPELGSL